MLYKPALLQTFWRYEAGVALVTALLFVVLTDVGFAAKPEGVTIQIDVSQTVRQLPDRAILGQNLSYANGANQTWDSTHHAFRPKFWKHFSAINPGLLRFPGGNWCYGFHFNLARQGIPHWVNTNIVTPHYRPQDFLQTIRKLPDAVALIHLSPIWSSPEESAAFIAYMVGKTSDKRKIGLDSWKRLDPKTKKVLDWQTVSYWAKLRESDGEAAYRGTLYFQVGNEEWFGWCRKGVCGGRTDYYGRTRTVRQMTIDTKGLKDPVSGVEVEAYWPNYRDIYLKIREFFPHDQVKVGALVFAQPDGIGGADAFFRTSDGRGKRWNVELLKHLNGNSNVTADFLTLHTYMYDKNGWAKDFPSIGTANVLFASDHLASRIEKIFEYAKSPGYPVMVTEFNLHLHKKIAPSSLLSTLFYVDYSMSAWLNRDIVGMVRWQTANWRQHGGFRGDGLFATNAGRRSSGKRIWKMGPYYAARLLGNLHKNVVSTAIDHAPTFRPRGLSGKWIAGGETAPWWVPSDLPMIVGVSTLSGDGKELAVLILNKHSTKEFDIRMEVNGFVPASSYTKIMLNATNPGGHKDLFKINPWRLTKKAVCVPKKGGCTRTLDSESNENVTLHTSILNGASGRFRVKVAPHSATLLKLDWQQDAKLPASTKNPVEMAVDSSSISAGSEPMKENP